ncbi:cinnamoyl-CoA reductase 1-like [Eucalyptus grandis]|uniref:cinnamoyl-CoA reductase 1-like n=1 Tax=Eucalyptus grandis TaxID=71139 RepID=UPI00192E992D|nr:cinnamoyl-CoA reductase 1-like [Eucalyptus grandis]
MRFAACFVRSEDKNTPAPSISLPNTASISAPMTAMFSAGKMCMTGASGYITSRFVKPLLQCGYTVNASVHDPSFENGGG